MEEEIRTLKVKDLKEILEKMNDNDDVVIMGIDIAPEEPDWAPSYEWVPLYITQVARLENDAGDNAIVFHSATDTSIDLSVAAERFWGEWLFDGVQEYIDEHSTGGNIYEKDNV